MKKIISLILFSVILVSVMFLNSCSYLEELETIFDLGHYPKNIFPEGYTGGFGIQPGSSGEYYWVETTEELIEAINLLKSHGSTFYSDDLYVYEGDMFDIKYCFVFGGSYKYDKEKVEYGENPYDRWATNVFIRSYAFFDGATIEEISYSYVGRFDSCALSFKSEYSELAIEDIISDLEFSGWQKSEDINRHSLSVKYEGKEIAVFTTDFSGDKERSMTDDCIIDYLTNGRFIELNEADKMEE